MDLTPPGSSKNKRDHAPDPSAHTILVSSVTIFQAGPTASPALNTTARRYLSNFRPTTIRVLRGKWCRKIDKITACDALMNSEGGLHHKHHTLAQPPRSHNLH